MKIWPGSCNQKKKILPVKRMRIVVVIERMELETGYTRVGKG